MTTLTSRKYASAGICLLLVLGAPLAAVSAERTATVVRADQRSGRLVRTVVPVTVHAAVVEPVTAPGAEPRALAAALLPSAVMDAGGLKALVDRIAAEIGVEESLVHSVIRAESNYNPRAVSPKGALGLMQLIPATARRFGVSNVFDAKDNIQGGVRYLKFLLAYYDNDYSKAIAAYNAGEAAVDKYHGIPPYPETQMYVYRVAKNLKTARQARSRASSADGVLLAGLNTAANKTEAGDKPETYKPIAASLGEDGRIYYRTQ